MVKHILSDGTVLKDITGHVVKVSDAPDLYNLIDSINQSIEREGAYEEEKSKKQGA